MQFHLSLASLVDQRGTDYSDLFLDTNSTLAPFSPPYLNNNTLAIPLNSSIPQIFVVNPTSDNIFRHVNPQSAHAAIVGLIYFSMWMGALGWDIVSTIHFDLRLIRETSWSSSFSSLYSIAYLLSRYMSLAWLTSVVTNSVIMTNRCDAWMKGSTAMFSVAISATMLVFCLRTCSIWHMRQRVVSLVVSAWLIVVSFAILLPVMSYGSQLPTSNFCAWHFNGLYVVGVFGALLLFDLLCLILTVFKLNKAGWRGLVHGVFPSSRYNLDAEDVKTMLVQKTTAFFVIQFLFLISALLIYVLTDTYAYRMMNIVASVAVASSMAGRIFRRAWRQTRELAPHNLNRPPSYFPAWAEEHRDSGLARPDRRPSYTPGGDALPSNHIEGEASDARNKRDHDTHDSLAFYVEGEYRPKLQSRSRSMSSQSLRSTPRTPVSANGQQQMRDMESGEAGADPIAGNTGIAGGTMIISRNTLLPPSTNSQHGPAPAYTRRLDSAGSSRPATGDQRSVRTSPSGEMFALSRGAVSPARNTQGLAGTDEPSMTSLNSSMVSFSSLGDEAVSGDRRSADRSGRASHEAWPSARVSDVSGSLLREERTISRQKSSPAMDDRRRTFVASPPMTARMTLNSKEVYDVDTVKAAARLGARHGALHKSFSRPATASSALRSAVSPATSFGSLRSQGDSLPSLEGVAADVHAGEAGVQHAATVRKESRMQNGRSPRPKTAPDASSPSLSPSGSVVSQMTLMPHDFGLDSVNTGPMPAPGRSASAEEEDVLFAFLDTVEQDARDQASHAPAERRAGSASSLGDEERPRTARGNTASSGRSSDEGGESDMGTVLGHDGGGWARAASSAAALGERDGGRPRSGVASPREARGSSSVGARKRLGTSESSRSERSSAGTRPSTAVGEAVKPFGYVSSAGGGRRGSRARSMREHEEWARSDEKEAEAEGELGSVIQQQYAKLAARAQMPLDPPC